MINTLSEEDLIVVNALSSTDGDKLLQLLRKEYYDIIVDPNHGSEMAVFINGQRSVVHNLIQTIERAKKGAKNGMD